MRWRAAGRGAGGGATGAGAGAAAGGALAGAGAVLGGVLLATLVVSRGAPELCAMTALAAAIESARACAAAIAAFEDGAVAPSRGREVADTGGSGNRRAVQIWNPTNPTAIAIATVIANPTHLLRVGSAPTPSIAGSGIISGSAFAGASDAVPRGGTYALDILGLCTVRSSSSCSTSSEVL